MPAQPGKGKEGEHACQPPARDPFLLEDIQEMLSSQIGGWEIFSQTNPVLIRRSDSAAAAGHGVAETQERRMKPAANWETMGKARKKYSVT